MMDGPSQTYPSSHRPKRSLVDILTEVGVKGIMVIDPSVPGDECPGGKGGDAADCLEARWTPEQTREWQKRNRIHPDEFRRRVAARAAAPAPKVPHVAIDIPPPIEADQGRSPHAFIASTTVGQPGGKPVTRVLPGILWREIKLEGNPLKLVKGLLAGVSLICVVGAPKSGKTFFVLDLAVAIATGSEWRGRKVQQGGVCYIAGEGQVGLRARVEAIRRTRQPDEDMQFTLIPIALNLATATADADALIAKIRSAPWPTKLVVIDTLARNFGGGNESSAEDMGAFVANCDRLREATGAAVIAVHHFGKDSGRGARGSNALPAAVDTEIQVERGDGNITRATVTLQKDGEDGLIFPFQLKRVDLGTDDDGDEITSMVVEHIDAEDAPQPVTRGRPKTVRNEDRNAMTALTNHFAGPVADWITYEQFKDVIVPLAFPDGEPRNGVSKLRDRLKAAKLIAVHVQTGNIALKSRLDAPRC